ncbi:MAG: PCMD domain-containing protein, partial [Muribaculaceae bacterium]|nr:PCMD domain-containing protein [Muribaculaceae bacterium]
PDSPEVIAYGSVQYGETIEQWTKFDIELNYRSTSRVPNYILVVASASKYGDYFVGGNGSVLCIDNFKLEYDY